MKRWATFVTWVVWFLRLLTAANLLILAWGLWHGDDTAEAITLIGLALVLFLWPDPKDRKINQSVKNPYQDGRK